MGGAIVAIVGMPGSGKTDAAEFFVRRGFQFIRFGQLTLDEVKKRGLAPNEESERKIREELRKEYGMAAFAKLNIPKIDELLKKGDVVIDGLRSWQEYELVKGRYGNKLSVLAIYSSPKTRYKRLTAQKIDKSDKELKRREFTIEEAISRDKAEIEILQIGGTIAMADYTVINESSKEQFKKDLMELSKKIG